MIGKDGTSGGGRRIALAVVVAALPAGAIGVLAALAAARHEAGKIGLALLFPVFASWFMVVFLPICSCGLIWLWLMRSRGASFVPGRKPRNVSCNESGSEG